MFAVDSENLVRLTKDRRVAIPSAQYKIVACWKRGQWETLTVVIPNTDQLVEADEMIDFLSQDIKSLDDINRATGLRFFCKVAL